MMKKRIVPDLKNFNGLLGAAKKCGIGPQELTSDILLASLSRGQILEYLERLNETIDLKMEIPTTSVKDSGKLFKNPPNLTVQRVNSDSLVGFSKEIKTPRDRFLMIGDVDGFLKNVINCGVQPDEKMFILLVSLIEDNNSAEEKLLETAKEHGVKLTTAFFNLLITRKTRRKHYQDARDTFELMSEHGITPDHSSYVCLASASRGIYTMRRFFNDCERNGIGIDHTIFNKFTKGNYSFNIINYYGFIRN